MAQNKVELENKRKEKIKEIEYTSSLVNKNKQLQKASVDRLKIVQRQIQIREQVIENLNNQLVSIDSNITRIYSEIFIIDSAINHLKTEYARIIFNQYKQLSIYNPILYILSSANFNQLYNRIKYIQQYSKYRISQVTNINIHKSERSIKIRELITEKDDKSNVLLQLNSENIQLQSEREIERNFQIQLKSKEKELLGQLEKLKEVTKQIEKEIQNIIEEEIKKSKNKKTTEKSKAFDLSLSKDFKLNKGKLPWPIEKGVVVSEFGEHNHPVLKGIKIKNNGIDISVKPGIEVKAVFSGIVSKVFSIKGSNFAIIIRHGNFLTVYQNIVNVSIKAGDEIKVLQKIGYSPIVDDEASTIHFEIWEELLKNDPQIWLNKNN